MLQRRSVTPISEWGACAERRAGGWGGQPSHIFTKSAESEQNPGPLFQLQPMNLEQIGLVSFSSILSKMMACLFMSWIYGLTFFLKATSVDTSICSYILNHLFFSFFFEKRDSQQVSGRPMCSFLFCVMFFICLWG